jgi:hypothetical protein
MLTYTDLVDFRHFMAKELTRRMAARREARIAAGFDPEPEVVYVPWWRDIVLRVLSRKPTSSSDEDSDDGSIKDNRRGQRLRTDMIKRTNGAPQRVTPSGFLSEATTIQENLRGPAHRQPPPSPGRQLESAGLQAAIDLQEAVDTSSSTFEDEDDDSNMGEAGSQPSLRSRPTARSKYTESIP